MNFAKKIKIVVFILVTLFMVNVLPFSIQPGLAQDDFRINLHIAVDKIIYETTLLNDTNFALIRIDDEQLSCNDGTAKLPVINKFIEIPQGPNQPIITINDESWQETSLSELKLPDKIVPSQPSILKSQSPDSNTFVIDNEYYSLDAFQPEQKVEIQQTGQIRAHRFLHFKLNPVRYNPLTGNVQILRHCNISIKIPTPDMQQTQQVLHRYNSEEFEYFSKTLFDNSQTFLDNNGFSSTQKNQLGYLIIVYDDFYDEIIPLATWKERIGFSVTTTNTSDIPGGPTKNNIKAYIQTAYDNWSVPPSYVLLVGDIAQVPTFIGTVTYPYTPDAVDLYYVTLAGSDYFPDAYIGRFPAATEADVNAMVNKTLYYEKGNFDNTSWIKKAAFMAGNDNYQVSEGTHNYVISNHLNPNNYTCDKIYEVTYGAVSQDVTNALNNGRSLAIFSGHGSQTSWADGPSYSQSNVNNLMNSNIYPFVCSHACLTGSFQISECFGETWLRAPNKGGLAFWGASESTYWDEDDILEKGMFQAWWDDGVETIGAMTDKALYSVYENYSGGGKSLYYYEIYNILGDPSIALWQDEPNIGPFHISNVSEQWNLISLPFNDTVQFTNLTVCYNNTNFTWSEAINHSPPLIDQNVYSWDNIQQTYSSTTQLIPGTGYWLYSYSNCSIFTENVSSVENNYVTSSVDQWNIISNPFSQSYIISNLQFITNNTAFTWDEAINISSGPLIDQNIYGWNTSQFYEISDILEAGKAYWMYSFTNCTILRS